MSGASSGRVVLSSRRAVRTVDTTSVDLSEPRQVGNVPPSYATPSTSTPPSRKLSTRRPAESTDPPAKTDGNEPTGKRQRPHLLLVRTVTGPSDREGVGQVPLRVGRSDYQHRVAMELAPHLAARPAAQRVAPATLGADAGRPTRWVVI